MKNINYLAVYNDIFKFKNSILSKLLAIIITCQLGTSAESSQNAINLQNEVKRLNQPEELAKRCNADNSDDQFLYQGEFHWGYSLKEMQDKYEEIYASGKRLPTRLFMDKTTNSFKFPKSEFWKADANVPMKFVDSVRKHVETALRLGYVNAIFFPDMGHSHFYVPKSRWDMITDFPIEDQQKIYEGFFNEPELKVLYHTAEQLQTLDENKKPIFDRSLLWRFLSRNIMGDNKNQGNVEIVQTKPGTIEYSANSFNELEGYARWGAGFNISASSKGCYAFTDGKRILFFDLSLSDLVPDPNKECVGCNE